MEWIDIDALKAIRADFIPKSYDINSLYPTNLLAARIESKEKRDFKQELNAWRRKYSYKGKEKGDEKMITDNTLNEIYRDFQMQQTTKYMAEENSKRKKQEDETKKHYLEEQQIMNNHTLNWIVNNMIKDIKVDWTNKTVVVFWADGIKNYVHCMEGDEFNPEYGIMRCVFKRAFGNGNNLKRFFKKYIPENNAKIVVEDELHSDNHTEITYENALRNVVDTYTDASEKKDDAEDYFNEELEKRLIFTSKEIDGEEKEND